MTQAVAKTALTGCLAPIDKTGLDELIAKGKADPKVIKTLKCKTVAEGRGPQLKLINSLPADVVFYAVKTEIRSAVLDDPVPALLETLGDDALTLDEWAERVGLRDSAELLELTKRLAELGVLAFS